VPLLGLVTILLAVVAAEYLRLALLDLPVLVV
jgi:hypothetical protein